MRAKTNRIERMNEEHRHYYFHYYFTYLVSFKKKRNETKRKNILRIQCEDENLLQFKKKKERKKEISQEYR